jgi:hypothetical protein
MYEEIRKKVSMDDFLSSVLGDPVATRTGPRWSNCPHCGPSDHDSRKVTLSGQGKFFRCFACGSHGDVIEAAALYYRCSHKEAAVKLCGSREQIPVYLPVKRKPVVVSSPNAGLVAEAMQKLIDAQEGYWDYDVVSYLTLERGLPLDLLRAAHSKGYLRMLSSDVGIASSQLRRAIGDDLLVAAGLLNPDKRLPAIAFRPIIFGLPGSEAAEFRGLPSRAYGPKYLRNGSPLMPWRWNEGHGSVALVEGLIDVLSLVTMGYQDEVIGLPGCRQWNPAWNPLLAERTVIIKLDPDDPGQQAAADLSTQLQSEGIRAWVDCPKNGDINEELLISLGRRAA